MAGTFPGVCNAQQFDVNGNPLVGGFLYVFNGGTNTLASLYQDIGLALALSNPIQIEDTSGRLPIFFVADGVYRMRLTDSTGATANGGFDYPQVPSIGASSSGGGGAAVDPTTIFQTGDPLWVPIAGSRTGWVRMNGRTLGGPTSGASERANNDAQVLFEYLWNTYPDTICPVVGGRGASALADWTAAKQITLLDMRGKGASGLADMGNTDSGAFTNVPFLIGNATTAASTFGENTHTLTKTEIPKGLFTINFADPGHSHTYSQGIGGNQTASGPNPPGTNFATGNTGTSTTGISVSLTDNAGGLQHNNSPLSMTGTWFIKL